MGSAPEICEHARTAGRAWRFSESFVGAVLNCSCRYWGSCAHDGGGVGGEFSQSAARRRRSRPSAGSRHRPVRRSGRRRRRVESAADGTPRRRRRPPQPGPSTAAARHAASAARQPPQARRPSPAPRNGHGRTPAPAHVRRRRANPAAATPQPRPAAPPISRAPARHRPACRAGPPPTAADAGAAAAAVERARRARRRRALSAIASRRRSTAPRRSIPRPITPRSPRAALQPENVPMPTRRSRRARNPIVIAGNALLTVIFLVTVVGGVGFVIGKQRFELPGPLAEDKVVNIPRGGIRDTADLLVREGVIDQPYLFIAGALVLKAQNELKYGEYQLHQERQPARRGRDHHRRQGGAARLHHRRGSDLRPDRAAAAGERRCSPATSATSRARARCCRRPTGSPAAPRASR